MKIYAGKSDISILQFLGEDIWVKCHTYGNNTYYVRPVRIIHEDFGMCNIFPANWIDDYDYYFSSDVLDAMLDDYINDWINYARPFTFSTIEVIEPIEAITTSELYELLGIE